jgi:hypothetical protein
MNRARIKSKGPVKTQHVRLNLMVSIKHKKLRLVIYPNDHDPAHVHVVGPDYEVRVNLFNLKLMSTKQTINKVKRSDRIEAIKAVINERQQLLKIWRETHGADA